MAAGEITFNAKPMQRMTPQRWIAEGLAFISEDRRGEGLLMPKPVEDNLILVKLPDIARRLGRIREKEVSQITGDIIRDFGVKVADQRIQMASNLSGGNQLKVVSGNWLARDQLKLIMDEPTRGVDVGAKYEIYSLILRLAQSGSGILCISSEMEELMGICDRIVVMKDGVLTGELSRDEYDPKRIMDDALVGGKSNG